MKWRIIILFCAACSVFCAGEVSHEPTLELMRRKPIRMTGGGRVAIPFEDAVAILGRDDFLTAIQESYAGLLPDGETPEFVVKKTGPGVYSYVNRDGQHTSIEEVVMYTDSNQRIEVALYSEGRRFFGEYQSFCQIEVLPAGEGQVDYAVTVYARPESMTARFLSRVMPVELYFRHKLKEMTGLVVEVCAQMVQPDSVGGACAALAL